ncbi:hypothetical protein SAMD00019534_015900 [Acytostelium subglobosum LB1]|uniref:hypothetical protein n=1 Tax=Acytostelium subglobosum LB1 TaxID=1410327 RepID=UPI0006450837|nr:hypothetical protein SAMD00019534_015900 [Acytostelium subglobosum LB1]GAM18415.1 hypothetical protein SAMD00019534_015900 [Acytostelium subglobosum LB1]|eukprot:XP_012757635.1 hypothetical protein SAMD00019534_015900 [Acytostelium subglobosum LB1]
MDDFIKEKRRLKFESQYMFVKILSGKTLEETLQSFIADADALKQGTNGIIDMYFTGHNINKAAISHFLSYNKAVYPEHIQQDEGEWISKASCGPLVFAVEGGYTGPLYKYDVSKMYASIMKSSNFMVPIKRGEFKQLTDDDITHPPFAMATELGLTYNLKIDNKPNALLYGPECRMYSVTMFGDYIDQVLGWIKAGVPRAKQLYQCLWGALSKRNKVKRCISVNGNDEVRQLKDGATLTTRTYDVTLPDNYLMDRITPTINGHIMVRGVDNTDMFNTPFARLMPFIISRGRKMIGTIIKGDIDNVMRVHTDGWYMTVPWEQSSLKTSLDYPKLGIQCGDVRYEGYCDDGIVNKMHIVRGLFMFNE